MQKPRWGGDRPSSLRRGRWSAEELARFRELYGLRDERSLARELNRSISSIRKLARSLYDDQPLRTGPWSDEEEGRLRRFLGASTLETLRHVLAREARDIEDKVAELAQRRERGPWSLEAIADFKRFYGTRADEDLAIAFGRSVDEIRSMASELRISKDKAFLRRQSGGKKTTRMPRWSPEELAVLAELYPTASNLEIAKRLDRSVKSVVSKAHNLGLKKDRQRLEEMGRQNVSLRYRHRGASAEGGADGDAG